MNEEEKRLVFDLAYNVSPIALTAIVRCMGSDPKIGDDLVRIFSSALCLSWMDSSDLYGLVRKMTTGDSKN